jgi:hypothetical protein
VVVMMVVMVVVMGVQLMTRALQQLDYWES